MVRTRAVLAGIATLAASAAPAAAQVRAHGMAQVVPIVVTGQPVPGGGSLTEFRVVQPVAMGTVAVGGPWRGRGTLDLEGLTMPGGEYAPGAWGEGFFDRRHPHTYVHELVAWNRDLAGTAARGWAASVTAGKGFVPFGTDDPMVRPFLRYPVNHHWAQILERLVAAGGVRVGPVAAEAALFNGDEPQSAGQWPNASRFGDSWAVRGFVWPVRGLELQASVARVHSPEDRSGAGLGTEKASASARWERRLGGLDTYALVEWARSTEADGAFTYGSALAEGAVWLGPHRLSYRVERTTRPEEERLTDPFRSVRPHLDDHVVGRTRWALHTIQYALRVPLAAGRVGAVPFVEVTLGRVARDDDGLFDPAELYGTTDVRTLTAGVRLDLGGPMRRMGRYGVVEAQDARSDAGHAHHEEDAS